MVTSNSISLDKSLQKSSEATGKYFGLAALTTQFINVAMHYNWKAIKF